MRIGFFNQKFCNDLQNMYFLITFLKPKTEMHCTDCAQSMLWPCTKLYKGKTNENYCYPEKLLYVFNVQKLLIFCGNPWVSERNSFPTLSVYHPPIIVT